jgi:hypothetical protein
MMADGCHMAENCTSYLFMTVNLCTELKLVENCFKDLRISYFLI